MHDRDEQTGIPEIGDLSARIKTLDSIADKFMESTPEHEAIIVACHPMEFVSRLATRSRFQKWLDNHNLPLTALDILHAKLAGIDDLPHELLDETMIEIESLLERLRHTRR